MWGDFPSRMLNDGREPHDVAMDEMLFLRVRPAHCVDGLVTGDAINKVVSQSVNRSASGGEPSDAIRGGWPEPNSLGWPDCGVMAIAASQVPPHLTTDGGVRFVFSPAHDPLDRNWYHTEIRASRDGKRCLKIDSVQLKREYRDTLLSSPSRLVIQPRPPSAAP